ncbi:MAG: Gfo/Idh/MocA family protein [Actinomycetota bacterium]
MRVGVIGCGVIGSRRAGNIAASKDDLIVVADIDPKKAQALADEHEAEWTDQWEVLLKRDDIDAVVVATTNQWLAPISQQALESNKHVLCEKPMGRSPLEVRKLVEIADANGLVLKTGFNLRHAPAISKAHEALKDIGDVMFIRARYGHGGRPGMESEWRCNLESSGGGELLDQGIHVLDLFRWFAGDFNDVSAFTSHYVWKQGSDPVEDNAFAMFRSDNGIVATLHASWTQWKNIFSFEVFGTRGYAIVEGLGGSYGPSTLRVGTRKMKGGVPEEQLIECEGSDVSWPLEWEEFSSAVRNNKTPLASGEDGLRALEMVFGAYESSRIRSIVRLEQ